MISRTWFIFMECVCQKRLHHLVKMTDVLETYVSFFPVFFSLIVWVCSPGNTVQRSKLRPRLWGLCKAFSSVGLHIWSEDVVVMSRLRWSDPKDQTVRERLLHKAENLYCLYRGSVKRRQPSICHTIVGFCCLQPSWFIFTQNSHPSNILSSSSTSVSSPLFTSHSINKQPLPSQPPFLIHQWCMLLLLLLLPYREDVMTVGAECWRDLCGVTGRHVLHFQVDRNHCHSMERLR